MLETLSQAAHKVVGAKRVLRALEEGNVRTAYVAKDADAFLTKRVQDICYNKGIQCLEAPDRQALGKASGIEVPAAAAAVLKQ